MTYEKIFDNVKKAYLKADKERLTGDFAFQFNITGKGEGIFYVAYRGGELEVAPYDYVDRNALLSAAGDAFMKLAGGKLTLEDAVSSGLIHVEGDYDLARELNKMAVIDKTDKADKPEKKTKKDNETSKSVKKTTTAKPKPASPITAVASTAVMSVSGENTSDNSGKN